ncbi:uncharacterized protein GGS25DRAFT_522986 [Hypoxylon fragiforme]|uniref:uncharacterized protein n=1 Tax=Hypoxylon fragiforme TaxID=63214 RepID=UPI0020C6409C|nr:uncharacterized protein GGS25DRAFT_522986 [Hypoxylon fragiforme]KAI2607464.1 hypothetical protein GGS25DRAFT_522986 [Hypoxylon fragiforme]
MEAARQILAQALGVLRPVAVEIRIYLYLIFVVPWILVWAYYWTFLRILWSSLRLHIINPWTIFAFHVFDIVALGLELLGKLLATVVLLNWGVIYSTVRDVFITATRWVDRRLARSVPIIVGVFMLVLNCAFLSVWMFYLVDGDIKRDLVHNLQPGPLTWDEEYVVGHLFRVAASVDRVRWRHTAGGEVVRFMCWNGNGDIDLFLV